MEYRRANSDDVALFLENRMEFVGTMVSIDNMSDFMDRTQAYIRTHINKDDLLIFIAVENNKIIASCMACIFDTIPVPSCISGKRAELLNVFTHKEYRRRGHAKKLIGMLMREVKSYGVEKITLCYTQDGLPLYQQLGFTYAKNQMEIKV